MFLLNILNSVGQKSTWFFHRSVPNFPMRRVFHVFENMFISLSMAMPPMNINSWYSIEYMFLLIILNSAGQKYL